MIGKTFFNYKITKKIGDGGMATVYEAIHEQLETKAAIKILHQNLTTNENVRKRFSNEAKALYGLSHPNIVRLLNYHESEEELVMILDYVDGIDLKTYIEQNPSISELENAIPFFIQILAAFNFAHQNNIIHRDIKPSNIMVTSSGKPIILDFGIAKVADDLQISLTGTNAMMGSRPYMSPEQIKSSKHIDKRSDVYSLGITLYQLLTRESAYNTNTLSEYDLIMKIVNEPLPLPSSKNTNITPALDKVIQKATAKDPNARFESCEEFSYALNNLDEFNDSTIIEEEPNFEETKIDTTPVNEVPTEKASIPKENNQSSDNEEERKKKMIMFGGAAAAVVLLIVILTFSLSSSDDSVVTANVVEETPEETSMQIASDSLVDSLSIASLEENIDEEAPEEETPIEVVQEEAPKPKPRPQVTKPEPVRKKEEPVVVQEVVVEEPKESKQEFEVRQARLAAISTELTKLTKLYDSEQYFARSGLRRAYKLEVNMNMYIKEGKLFIHEHWEKWKANQLSTAYGWDSEGDYYDDFELSSLKPLSSNNFEKSKDGFRIRSLSLRDGNTSYFMSYNYETVIPLDSEGNSDYNKKVNIPFNWDNINEYTGNVDYKLTPLHLVDLINEAIKLSEGKKAVF
ncbi:serine/threonine-protein kinase [Flammeovirga agarivorans]|uniref:Serine/threonine protein kinase n=1 Tax=Flammeovirga agarivorans TaxID=2726742 RepID=A0A7X8SQB3_9BACT|nr:serine/threonine-protein kinase [Flammeovirga agarivorans]NLR94438.1 serine/threonine protein kinase [Flammeovirga agarivorans]